MKSEIIYKYLDLKGALFTLKNRELQFTNPAYFNDPLDCHPSLIEYSNVPSEKCGWMTKEVISAIAENKISRVYDDSWICCLSKTYDNFLMWSYYTKHRGVCIGFRREKLLEYINASRGVGFWTMPDAIEVQYRDIVEKPDYFNAKEDMYQYLFGTKAKVWEHEQEVRLVINKPLADPARMRMAPNTKSEGLIDWKELRAYPRIGAECFDSIYFGVNISESDKKEVLAAINVSGLDMNAYQMMIDTKSYRLFSSIL